MRNPTDFRKYTFLSNRGSRFSVNVPIQRADRESFFVFSGAKCGSTLLDNIMKDICRLKHLPVIDIPGNAFAEGTPMIEVNRNIERILYPRGFAYLGFRGFFFFRPQFDFARNKKILLLRDPKDAMVSLYFSVTRSHRLPEKGTARKYMNNRRQRFENSSLEDFVRITLPTWHQSMSRYLDLPTEKLKVFRYEDVIYNKLEWINQVCDFLDIDIEPSQLQSIVTEYDIFPDQEDTSAHIRQVHPGNHKNYLGAECIAEIDNTFSAWYKAFGY